MKAIVCTRYGGPDVLQLKEIEKQYPASDEVLVRVFAASINDWDWGLLHGDTINRLMYGWREPKIKILGSDIAGVVEAVGKDVTQFKPGDEVFGDLSGRWGGFAEYVCAPEKMLGRKPASMSFEEAAAIPQAAMLAVQGLIDTAKIRDGQKLLINGAGGGVGTFGLQIAKLHGAEVTVVDSGAKLEMLRSLGADYVIDYTREDFTRSGRRYDVILDVKTNRPILNYLRALNPGGMYVTVGGSLTRLFQALLLMPWIRMFSSKKVAIVALKPNKDLGYMSDLFEKGHVRAVIDGPYRLEDAAEAFRHFGRAAHRGKVVISVSG